LAILRTADYGSDGRALASIPCNSSDCSPGSRTLGPTVGVLLFLALRLLLVLRQLLALCLWLGLRRRRWRLRLR
jgi:hypothetical protein